MYVCMYVCMYIYIYIYSEMIIPANVLQTLYSLICVTDFRGRMSVIGLIRIYFLIMLKVFQMFSELLFGILRAITLSVNIN